MVTRGEMAEAQSKLLCSNYLHSFQAVQWSFCIPVG